MGRAGGRAASVAATASRTEANVKLDEGRKPAEVLSFLGLEKGARVLDMFGANQYWAEIIAPAVGPNGFVVVWQPNQFLNDKRKATFAEFAGKQKNVLLINSPFEQPSVGTNAYDFILMNLDYHDVYWESSERKIAPNGARCVAAAALCRGEAGRDGRHHRPYRNARRRHPRGGGEAPSDRPGRGEGRFPACRLRA